MKLIELKEKSLLEKIMCIHKYNSIKSKNCEDCTGITNACGYYRNPYNLDPFAKIK